jgi:hypothetical protein
MLQANTGRLPVLCRTLEWFSVVSFFFYTPETEKNNLVLETVAVSKKTKTYVFGTVQFCKNSPAALRAIGL